jgi:hypothetical protein
VVVLWKYTVLSYAVIPAQAGTQLSVAAIFPEAA